jgi:hypothetical protein
MGYNKSKEKEGGKENAAQWFLFDLSVHWRDQRAHRLPLSSALGLQG